MRSSADGSGHAHDSTLTERGQLTDPVRIVSLSDHQGLNIASDAHGTYVGILDRPPTDDRWRALASSLDVTYAIDIPEVPTSVVTTADPHAAASAFAEKLAANPQAATVLRTVLRGTSELPVRFALDTESFAYSTLLGGPEFAYWLRRRGPRPLPQSAPNPVLLSRNGSDLVITLNRPGRRNAYSTELRDALTAALDVARADETLTVQLRGAGPAFCAGGDLDEFGTAPDLTTAHLVRTIGGAGRRMAEIGDRTTVYLHGACIGAGIEIPAFAGRVVAAPSTKIRLPEIGMGLIPGAGGTVGIPRRIGRWRTYHLAVSGATVDAATAYEWGLVDDICESPDESA